MTKLEELNETRCQMSSRLNALGAMNQPTKAAERLKSDAAYHLAWDAWMRAEREYAEALASTPTDELRRIANI